MVTIHAVARRTFPWLARVKRSAALRVWLICAATLLAVGAASGNDVNVSVDGSQTYQVIDGFGVVGPECERILKMAARVLMTAQLPIREPKVIVTFGVSAVERDRFGQIFERRLDPSGSKRKYTKEV